jgi:hypothetical protein
MSEKSMFPSNQVSTSGRHRYLVRISDDQGLRDHVSECLEEAMAHLWCGLGVEEAKGINSARLASRWMLAHASTQVRLFGSICEGRWLSLDPEDAHDALLDSKARTSFEDGITLPPDCVQSITYRLRMTHPYGVEAITEYTDVRSAFQSISDAWDYRPPLGPGFTWGLSRGGPERDDFALSARIGLCSAAIPLALTRAEQALVSSHAELDLVRALHDEIILVR